MQFDYLTNDLTCAIIYLSVRDGQNKKRKKFSENSENYLTNKI